RAQPGACRAPRRRIPRAGLPRRRRSPGGRGTHPLPRRPRPVLLARRGQPAPPPPPRRGPRRHLAPPTLTPMVLALLQEVTTLPADSVGAILPPPETPLSLLDVLIKGGWTMIPIGLLSVLTVF